MKQNKICLGIESTAHTFGIGIIDEKGKVYCNVKDSFITEQGGMIPHEVAKHHRSVNEKVLDEALEKSGLQLIDIDIISFSQSPGLPPALLAGRDFAVELRERIEGLAEGNDAADGRRTIASQSSYSAPHKGPASSASVSLLRKNAKSRSDSHDLPAIGRVEPKRGRGGGGGIIISQTSKTAAMNRKGASKKVPIIGVNHCIAHLEIGRQQTKAKDPVLLYASGANTQVIAYEAKKYRIFGETLDQGVGNAIDSFGRYAGIGFPAGPKLDILAREGKQYIALPYTVKGMDVSFSGILTKLKQYFDSKQYKMEDLAYSMQETMFAMLVEVSERAMAHTGKQELLLGGGVACNKRLQEMCRIMCEERGAKLYVPANEFLVDNGLMIAWQGLIEFKSGKKEDKKKGKEGKIEIKPYLRTDEVEVKWRK